MASIQETHAGVAGVTPHGQPRPLHRAADDDARTSRSKRATAVRPGSGPVRSITRGEAEGPATGPGSQGPEARKRQRNTEAEHEHPAHTNRVFVIGSDGKPLMPCTVQRARQLIDARRVKHRDYRPFTIHLKDRRRDDGQTPVQPTEVRCTPGARRTGIAVVIQLEHEDRVVYQEEVEHRTDIGRRLQERKGHRRRRRGTKWCRPPRFDNRRRGPEWVAPTIESIVSNQTHRLNRLAQRSGAGGAVVQTAKFDTQKILDPAIQGTEYQQGPLYRQHVRAYIAEQWKHRCAYCGKGNWEDATRFNLDHVSPRAHGGPDNVRNLVWACRPCNQKKADRPVAEFLQEHPERLTRVLGNKRVPLAAAGQHAAICKTLLQRLRAAGLATAETTGADTAYARREAGLEKSHANDAACCRSSGRIGQPRKAARLNATGHGRRKQIKGLPIGPYLAWRHRKPTEHRKEPCPGHAHHPNIVHGVRTGDTARVRKNGRWVQGRAQVAAATGRVRVQTQGKTASTSKPDRIERVAPRYGYRQAN